MVPAGGEQYLPRCTYAAAASYDDVLRALPLVLLKAIGFQRSRNVAHSEVRCHSA